MPIHLAPKNFIPAGTVSWARLMQNSPAFCHSSRAAKGAKLAGLKYEAKAHEMLMDRYPDSYVPGPWITFANKESRPRWCQPDGLIILPDAGRIIVVEIKATHTEKAWWQLFRLYIPVVQFLFGRNWHYSGCEVARWFDPAVICPEPAKLQKEITETECRSFGVHIWNSSRGY